MSPEAPAKGESQSNGLAERSVGIFEDQLRTLKFALEAKIQHRLPSSHPVTAWLVEHTSWVLNKFLLGSDGRTAYGRLHGREGRERICEFGETIMWFVPKKLRSKLDQRWRYGTFLGRALGSDQNYIGLKSGEVVCARAIVRVVPNARWSSDRISRITTSPMSFKAGTLDRIEESADPQSHPDPVDGEQNESRQTRRVRVFDNDVKRYGYTGSCPRCQALRRGSNIVARALRHNEECRERIYEALRADGVRKVRDADLTDTSRTQTRARRPPDARVQEPERAAPVDDQPVLTDEPRDSVVEMSDSNLQPTPQVYKPKSEGWDDTYEFYKEVDDDADRLDVDWTGEELQDSTGDHVMSPLMDVLQTLGLSPGEAAAYAVRAVRSCSAKSAIPDDHVCNPTLPSYSPTFFEVYGQGNLVKASHGIRRNLNINGLRALDLRTTKPDGTPWDFSTSADRRLAKQLVETEKPTWIVGCPPCTFFSAWNQR